MATGPKQLARTSTDYNAAIAAYTSIPATWAASIAAMTPALNGTAKNADGTYAGAFLPNGCWNMGEVY